MDCIACGGDSLVFDATSDTERLCDDCDGEGEVCPCLGCDGFGYTMRGACERECWECDGTGYRAAVAS